MRGQARAVLADITDPQSELDHLSETLRFELRPAYGANITIDLSAIGPPDIVRPFARALWRTGQVGGGAASPLTLKTYRRDIEAFFEYLKHHHPPMASLEELRRSDIDDYERWLAATLKGKMPWSRLSVLLRLLRLISEDGVTFRQDTLDRFKYVSERDRPRLPPRDAYDAQTSAVLRAAARKNIDAIHRRLTIDADKVPPNLAGVHEHASTFYRVLLAEIDRKGTIEIDGSGWTILNSRRQVRGIARQQTILDVYAQRYLLQYDLPAFLIILLLDTGLEQECAKTLRTDCLKNASRGYVEIEYCKRRARGAEWKRLRVRDGGIDTPGGTIRLLLKLTEPARRFRPSDSLWLSYSANHGLIEGFSDTKHMMRTFGQRHDLRDAKGKPLRVMLSRLRKTQKADWYVKTEGQLEQFAVGHTMEVAARHYADIPALRQVHEQTIADGIKDAFDAALQPRLIAAKEEADIRANPECSSLPVPALEVEAFLDGSQDLWLASCAGFYQSPFAKKPGEACPVPFWGCLACLNAVITTRKLPALLAFVDFMTEQREKTSARDWEAKFGNVHRRILHQILPAFPPDAIKSAKETAASMGFGDLLYLPPEVSAA
jgi:hypothetical protein